VSGGGLNDGGLAATAGGPAAGEDLALPLRFIEQRCHAYSSSSYAGADSGVRQTNGRSCGEHRASFGRESMGCALQLTIQFAYSTCVRLANTSKGVSVATISSLTEAIADLVHDGDTVAMEGFTHLIPFAAGHEVIRQRKRDLELVRMTPDLIYDQLIGAGCARRLVFSWGGNPGVGSLHRFRDAIATGWPAPLGPGEHRPARAANRLS